MKTAAAILAFLVGMMSITAGAKAMQGWDPGWSVLEGLPAYNFVMGIFTVAVPTILIWKNSPYAILSVIITFSVHALVTILLLTIFRSEAATQSIFAMASRLVVWLVILALMYFSARNNQLNS